MLSNTPHACLFQFAYQFSCGRKMTNLLCKGCPILQHQMPEGGNIMVALNQDRLVNQILHYGSQ